jgi:phosphoribosylformylglycinamidine (FGAM) synthase PurS component
MPAFEFAVELTVPDNTAFTVLTALRELGYRDLERVERADLLRMRLHEGAMTVDECGRALMRAEVVFNPNKHRLTYAADGESGSFEAVVAEKDDDASGLCDLLSGHFGVRGLEGVERAIAWRLYEKDGAAPKKRLEWACRELLANPFSQTYTVRARPNCASLK